MANLDENDGEIISIGSEKCQTTNSQIAKRSRFLVRGRMNMEVNVGVNCWIVRI